MANEKDDKDKKVGSTNATFIHNSNAYNYYSKPKLKNDIAWNIIVEKLLNSNYSLTSLANEIGTNEKVLQRLLQKDFKDFQLRLGVRLLDIYTMLIGSNASIT